MTFPKPERRAPKPPKRIQRGKRPRKQRKTTQAALGRLADKLWSQIIRRRGYCELAGQWPLCSGPLQGAHGFSRRYRGTRWLPINGFCICAAHHVTMTYDPLRWDDILRDALGEPTYRHLRHEALKTTKDLDLEEIVAKLKAELEAHS